MERYTRVFSLPTNLYSEGSLVIIEAGALLKDNANSTMLAQLKFKNVNPKAIKMLKVEIISKDSMGRVLEPATTYQYLDLDAQRGESFGSKQAITLPDSSVRSFDINVIEIGTGDNTIVELSATKWEVLPSPRELKETISDIELYKQYQITYGADYIFQTDDVLDLWYCACGEINHTQEMRCFRCGRSRSDLRAVDIDKLNSEKESRLLNEKKKAEEAEQKRKAELIEAEKKRKKIKKNTIIVAALMIIFVIIQQIITKVVIPQLEYNKKLQAIETATVLVVEEKYDEAIQMLKDLTDFENGAEIMDKAKFGKSQVDTYNQAEEALAEKDYRTAVDLYLKVPNYTMFRDAQEKLNESRYQLAISLLNYGKGVDYDDIEEAKNLFERIRHYKDSGEYLKHFFYKEVGCTTYEVRWKTGYKEYQTTKVYDEYGRDVANGQIYDENGYDISNEKKYDESGRLLEDSTTKYGYNSKGQLVSERKEKNEGKNEVTIDIKYIYGNDGQLTQHTYNYVSRGPNGYKYSNMSTYKYFYNESKQLYRKQQLGTGFSTWPELNEYYEYDSNGNMVKKYKKYYDNGSDSFSKVTFEYDNYGNLKSQIEFTNAKDGYDKHYDYDYRWIYAPKASLS